MMLRWRVVWLSLGVLLLALGSAAAVLPARWLIAMLPASWPVTVVDATGSIWSGSATLSIGAPGRQRTLPAPVQWQTTVWPRPQVQITHPWLGGPLFVRPAGLGVQVSAQTLTLPATALALAHDAIRMVEPAGELALNWPATRIGWNGLAPGATLLNVQWRNAASSLSTLRPLGDYQLQIKHATNGQLDLALSTRRGVLQLEGSGKLAGGLQFDGFAYPAPDAPAESQVALRELLIALGPTQNARTRLRWR